MNRSILFGLLLLCIGSSCGDNSFSSVTIPDYWIHYYGTDGDQTGIGLEKVSDGFVILGESKVQTNRHLFLSKTDDYGVELWSSVYFEELDYDFEAIDISPTSDGGFVVSATVFDGIQKDAFMMKVDASGAFLDSMYLGHPVYDDFAGDIIEASDNSYILAGTSFDDDPEVMKNGMTAWRTLPNDISTLRPNDWNLIYSPGDLSYGIAVVEHNGEFYFSGTSNAYVSAELAGDNIVVYKLNENGFPLHDSRFGTDQDNQNLCMKIYNQKLVVLGTTNNNGTQEVLIIEATTQNIQKISQLGFPSTRSIIPTSIAQIGGDYVILGTEINTIDDSNIYIGRVNAGQLLWERFFGDVSIDSGGKGVIGLPDGSAVFVGTIELGKQKKVMLCKIDKNGDLNN